MARVWYQWIDGEKKIWEANTLPDARTVFNANFINQFIGWSNYCHGIDPNEWAYTRIRGFISPGDIIQSADFWNSLRYEIRGWWGDQWGAFGFLYEGDETIDHLSPGVKTAGNQYASQNSTYNIPAVVEHHVLPFIRSDNLQAILPRWLMDVRWQLDQSRVYASHFGLSERDSFVTKTERWEYNWKYPPGTFAWEKWGTGDGKDVTVLGNYYADQVVMVETIIDANLIMNYPIAESSIIFEGDPLNAVIPGLIHLNANQFYCIGSNTISGQYPPVSLYPMKKRERWQQYASMIIRLCDDLPSQFRPPEY